MKILASLISPKIFLCGASLVVASGCCASSYAERGAMVGGGLGALTGAAIAQGGHPIEGALVGGLIGAAAGTVIGDSQDARVERDMAMAYAANTHVAAIALTNDEIARMVAHGLGDEVIISAIRSRGGRFDLGPDGLIRLKSSGVSERVILALQNSANTGTVSPAIVSVPGSPVVIEPQPTVEFGVFVGQGPIGSRRFGPPHHRFHRW